MRSVGTQKVIAQQESRNDNSFVKKSTPESVRNSSDASSDNSSLHSFGLNNFNKITILPPQQKLIQSKLKINKPGDKYEQEADRVADYVMRMPQVKVGNFKYDHENIQKKCAEWESGAVPCSICAEEEEMVQAKEKTGAASASFITSGLGVAGTGTPLSKGQKHFFEPRFGVDFSNVRIHADQRAAELSNQIGAKAFTYGSDIYFSRGEYNTGSQEGKVLLGHELTHVVQQRYNPHLIQRSCFDGDCKSCVGGKKTLWMTVFFARRADKKTMNNLRKDINSAKSVLAKCCLDLKFNFDWTLIPGLKTIKKPSTTLRPSGDPKGLFDIPAAQEKVAESKLISKAKGIPALVVDEVKGTGGAATILGNKDDAGNEFDTEYSGPNMVFIAPNQGGFFSGCSAIAHELWHVAGALRHDASEGGITACTNNNVSEKYCNAVRKLA